MIPCRNGVCRASLPLASLFVVFWLGLSVVVLLAGLVR